MVIKAIRKENIDSLAIQEKKHAESLAEVKALLDQKQHQLASKDRQQTTALQLIETIHKESMASKEIESTVAIKAAVDAHRQQSETELARALREKESELANAMANAMAKERAEAAAAIRRAEALAARQDTANTTAAALQRTETALSEAIRQIEELESKVRAGEEAVHAKVRVKIERMQAVIESQASTIERQAKLEEELRIHAQGLECDQIAKEKALLRQEAESAALLRHQEEELFTARQAVRELGARIATLQNELAVREVTIAGHAQLEEALTKKGVETMTAMQHKEAAVIESVQRIEELEEQVRGHGEELAAEREAAEEMLERLVGEHGVSMGAAHERATQAMKALASTMEKQGVLQRKTADIQNVKHQEELTRMYEEMSSREAKRAGEIMRLQSEALARDAAHEEMLVKHAAEVVRIEEAVVAKEAKVVGEKEEHAKGLQRELEQALERAECRLATHSEKLEEALEKVQQQHQCAVTTMRQRHERDLAEVAAQHESTLEQELEQQQERALDKAKIAVREDERAQVKEEVQLLYLTKTRLGLERNELAARLEAEEEHVNLLKERMVAKDSEIGRACAQASGLSVECEEVKEKLASKEEALTEALEVQKQMAAQETERKERAKEMEKALKAAEAVVFRQRTCDLQQASRHVQLEQALLAEQRARRSAEARAFELQTENMAAKGRAAEMLVLCEDAFVQLRERGGGKAQEPVQAQGSEQEGKWQVHVQVAQQEQQEPHRQSQSASRMLADVLSPLLPRTPIRSPGVSEAASSSAASEPADAYVRWQQQHHHQQHHHQQHHHQQQSA
jgi:hypothetical protein